MRPSRRVFSGGGTAMKKLSGKTSVDTLRRIARIICGALFCAGELAVMATAANAQTSRLAYRTDFVYGPFDCEAGCYWEVEPHLTLAGVLVYQPGYQPTWSPDGAWVAFTDGYDIFVVPATGGNAVRLTNATTSSFLAPAWSPDGGQIAVVRQTSEA